MENRMIPALFTKEGFETRKSIASTYAGGNVVPEAFQKNPANCFIAVNMAERMNADPMMIMQNMYIVYGRPSWSSQYLIGTFNNCGRFSSIKYEFFGKPGTDEYGCRAYATELATGEKVQSVDVTIGMAKAEGWYDKKGSKWKTMPQLMLQYRAATFLVRTVAPEISMGLKTTEEVIDIEPVNVTSTGSVQDVVDRVEAETQAALETAKEEQAVKMAAEPVDVEAPAPEPVKVRPF
ncbi:MAG: hypothetical protein J6M57_10255 [Acidaminococcaceae bacterium]|nr:hypothetical protein [Acidaminococcaceae bacterium]